MASIQGSLRQAVRRLQPFVRPRRGGLVVLEYHLVGGGTRSRVDVALDDFCRHLDAVEAAGPVVPLVEGVLAAIRGELPDGAVSITFDDAFANVWDVALPIMDQRGLPASVFVPTGFVRGEVPSPLSGVSLPACPLDVLRETAQNGRHTLGAHTVTHPTLSHLDRSTAQEEILGSKADLESMIGMPVRSFAYPRDIVAPTVRREVSNAFEVAVLGGGGTTTTGDDPHLVQRVPMRADSPSDLSSLLSSSYWLEERIGHLVRHRIK